MSNVMTTDDPYSHLACDAKQTQHITGGAGINLRSRRAKEV